MYILGANIYI